MYVKGLWKKVLPEKEYNSIPWQKIEDCDASFLQDLFQRIAYRQGEMGKWLGESTPYMLGHFGIPESDWSTDKSTNYWGLGHPKHHANEDDGQVGVVLNCLYNRDPMCHGTVNFTRSGLPINVKKQIAEHFWGSGDAVDEVGDYTPTNEAKMRRLSVAKEASDITLLDDSFNSIATAVMWGRSLYHNIQRFILFQLTINLSALLIVLIGSMFGRELPLTVTQMLWVNMIIDTFAAAALASLPPNPKVMNEMPRKSTDFIISPKMRNYILGIGLSFTVLLLGLMYWFTINDGVMSRHDLSVFFTTFVMLQFWNMFNAKAFLSHGSAFKNLKDSTGFLIVMFIIPIGQYLIVQFGGEVFRTVPLSWKDWGIIVGLTSLVLWIGEILRLMKKQ